MKKRILIIGLLLCLNLPASAQSILTTLEKLDINVLKSELNWSSDYTFYFGGHKGTVDFKEGYFLKSQDGSIAGGEFIIDMHSIACTDNGKIDKDSNLVEHLKNEDFFEVNTFPEAKLVIAAIEYFDDTTIRFNADLIIKGISSPIRFDAQIDYEKKQLFTKFKIDRQLWGIDYNSSMRDSAISDAIAFEVKLSL